MDVTNPKNPDFFEAVYYSWAVPRTLEALTILSLIFDRIHFPAVYMPSGFDEKAVFEEIQRIGKLGRQDAVQMLTCMSFALKQKYLSDFCVFPGRPGGMESFEPGVHELVDHLEAAVFGPRPEGEIPVHTGPWVKGLPGDDPVKCQVSAPDTITYPANALLYANRNELPLINDVSGLPVPGIPLDPKGNAKMLAMILTLESIALVLPNLKPLTPEALNDFREELAPHVRPFRLAMLRLTKELNASIVGGGTLADVQRHAKFLAETDVYPKLAELNGVIQNPKKHWYRRAVDLAKDAPELAANFAKFRTPVAIAKLLARVAETLRDVRDEQLSTQEQIANSGLYYLLKIKQRGQKQV